ncbi:MAG TPA: GNAT family N-acetyltransferase [Methanomassiliicoccales archaeon]|nr:GNAT family N-acetyltransferase [Methanomassiliicoccales archaeon]
MADIRALKENDRGHVRALELFCIREYLEASLHKDWDELPQDLVEQLGASSKSSFDHYVDNGICYVAVEGGQIVGFAFGQMLEWINNVPKTLWVESIAVHPNYRRRGIGFKLLKKMATEGKKKGAKAVESIIMPDMGPSVLLHKKIGFFMDGRKVAFLDLESFQ